MHAEQPRALRIREPPGLASLEERPTRSPDHPPQLAESTQIERPHSNRPEAAILDVYEELIFVRGAGNSGGS
jgi:hypothetical protein